ncbi:MAG: hypothetical protein NTY86_16255 [Deltaproteobacteria bacterium]|nr:hypothetical protein [Deltaproteobacteria bacterium]
MLFFSSEADFKKQIKHDIEWNEERIKSIKEWMETQTEWLKRTPDADTFKSIRNGITNSEDAIKEHQQFIANSQKRYAERYGNRYGAQKLTVIRGGLSA